MKKRILVVEDEESLLQLVTIVLSAQGYAVTGVRDGQAALDELEACRYALVVLDLMLPEMDGFQICRHIRDNPVTALLPIIILTAKKSRGDLAASRQAGADDYLTKPFKAATLLDAVARLVGREEA